MKRGDFINSLLWSCCLIIVVCSVLFGSTLYSVRDNRQKIYDVSYCGELIDYENEEISGDKITWVGDSYSWLAKDKIKKLFPGVDMGSNDKYVRSGRSLTKVNGQNYGFPIIEEIAERGEFRDYFVMMLATNDHTSGEVFESYLEEMDKLIPEDTKVILLAPGNLAYLYEDINPVIRSFVHEHSDRYALVDLDNKMSAYGDYVFDYYSQDRLHLSDRGEDMWLSFVKDALFELSYKDRHAENERVFSEYYGEDVKFDDYCRDLIR